MKLNKKLNQIKAMQEQIDRKYLIYEIKKYTYIFQKFKTISFGIKIT